MLSLSLERWFCCNCSLTRLCGTLERTEMKTVHKLVWFRGWTNWITYRGHGQNQLPAAGRQMGGLRVHMEQGKFSIRCATPPVTHSWWAEGMFGRSFHFVLGSSGRVSVLTLGLTVRRSKNKSVDRSKCYQMESYGQLVGFFFFFPVKCWFLVFHWTKSGFFYYYF